MIALHAAATEFHADGAYHLKGEGCSLSSDEMVYMWSKLCREHPIMSVEDPMD